jgi:thiol:disulfide interchange protein
MGFSPLERAVGIMELLKILIGVFLLIVAPIWLSFYLRRNYPPRLWVGIVLCVLFPLFGQFYLKDWAWYIIVIFVVGVVLYNLALGGLVLWTCMALISAGLMHYRFKKMAPAGNNQK